MALMQQNGEQLLACKSDQGTDRDRENHVIQNRAGDNTSDWLRQALVSEANLTEGNQPDYRNQSSIDRVLITNQIVGMSAMQQTHNTFLIEPQTMKPPQVPRDMLPRQAISSPLPSPGLNPYKQDS